MYKKRLASLTVPTELYQIEPLQGYIGFLARHAGVPENRIMPIHILIDELFAHIVQKCFAGRSDGTVTLALDATASSLLLTFSYQGLPFAYNLESTETEEDEISLCLIHSLSTSYRMKEDGKRGQIIEISIALQSSIPVEEPLPATPPSPDDAPLEFRQVRAEEMEKMVQCLYQVFGYTYSAEAIYCPDLLRERLQSGLYRGIVAVSAQGDIVAHVGMLRSSPTDTICECGQAFVRPEYGKRGLFVHLKQMLIDEAERSGLRGVFSSAVTGHPYTQIANLKLGCIETGMELSYIPHNLKSVISRQGEEQRQSVVSFFFPTTHQRPLTVYLPAAHHRIIDETYRHLGLERRYADPPAFEPEAAHSEVEEIIKSEWNQLHFHILQAGRDLGTRIHRLLRRALANHLDVAYVSLDLTDPATPHVAALLEQQGFVYAGIMPYELDDHDALRLQFLADTHLNGDYIIAHSEWANRLKQYILTQLNHVE